MTMPQTSPEPGSGLDPSVLDELRTRLLEARDFHRSRIEEGSDAVDDIARAIASRSEAALEEVEAALAAMEDGTYGTCQACGESVGEERLQAIPHARLCAACASTTARR
ncbi:MAG TPA: TraR/DksA C4-type zinc finger protein [Acidimicrobiia bacterium]|nr:TraR/DksA C4-type zinc finger protein [Acidimicrobiia bacterium]